MNVKKNIPMMIFLLLAGVGVIVSFINDMKYMFTIVLIIAVVLIIVNGYFKMQRDAIRENHDKKQKKHHTKKRKHYPFKVINGGKK